MMAMQQKFNRTVRLTVQAIPHLNQLSLAQVMLITLEKYG
ncbi:hypothetical protein BN439_1656 [Erwinia amylovora Ea644]|nr:hypothetical protein BN439_1656 [Erwinia amylovora Ea644]CCP06750.1 hypothetical protein BN440_1718 [Erwinia amylovora MR1]